MSHLTNTLTHINVGTTKAMSHITGEPQSIVILCGAIDGDHIYDSDTMLRSDGIAPAACNCGACKAIAQIMYQANCSVEVALRDYQRQATNSR